MKFILPLLALILPLSALEEGFKPLFNGKDLTGWTRVNGDGEFKVDGDSIAGVGNNVKSNTFLRTDKTYKDFDFRFEMKFDDLQGNSGVMFRGLQKPGADGRVNGYQCEHDNGEKRAWTAGLYDEARRGWLSPKKNDKDAKNPENLAAQKAFTEKGKTLFKWTDWNEIRILCEGKHIQMWLNGEKRVDYVDEAPEFTPEGFFALQVHAGKACHVRWRNLRIKEL
ncbi:MAG: hypothetical protein CFE26_02515 [Verrucomicrobiales bacterium VVV1]|nr:MAG: hypothetical protein CFE26_02515 [Verrucomicrobiales bacterium VVV1]